MALLDTLAAEGKSIDDKIDGYTEAQRYFLGFAQVWCQNQTEASARQSALDRSALARPLARQRLGAELRRVRQGLRLHQRPAHVPGQLLPRRGKQPPPAWNPAPEAFRISHHSRWPFGYLCPAPASKPRPHPKSQCFKSIRVPRTALPEPGRAGKCPVLPSLSRKLGTTHPWLLQCSRDPSQPSSAVELANLAAHAGPG